MTFRIRTVDELRAHARELAAAFGVAIEYRDDMTNSDGAAVGFGPFRVVFHKPIENEADYAGVLHEVGHHAAALGSGLKRGEGDLAMMIVQEEAAWEWAYDMASKFGFWTADMESVRTHALATYTDTMARLKADQEAAIEARRRRPSEPLAGFVARGHGEAPRDGYQPPLPTEAPKFSRRESVADFLKRRG